MFWGLRECRPIHFQSIQQAEVTIECAGVRITKTIRDVEKNPNFEFSSNDTDKYHLLVAKSRSVLLFTFDGFRIYRKIIIPGPI